MQNLQNITTQWSCRWSWETLLEREPVLRPHCLCGTFGRSVCSTDVREMLFYSLLTADSKCLVEGKVGKVKAKTDAFFVVGMHFHQLLIYLTTEEGGKKPMK